MAGTIVGTIERILTPVGRPTLTVIELSCTADGDDNSFPETVVNDLENIADFDLRGLRLYSVATVFGDPPPTDNSDLELLDRYGIDILAAAGANLVDIATLNRLVIGPASAVIVTGDITVKITGNAVGGAKTTIVLEFIGA